MTLSSRYLYLAFSLVFLFLLPASWLELQRSAVINSGEIWRLASAHWSHIGLAHLALNVAGTLALAALFDPVEDLLRWLLSLALIALGISVSLLIFMPELAWYRGFSGCIYGLFVYEAIHSLRLKPWLSLAILGFIISKLTIDCFVPSERGNVMLAGAPVIQAAHVAGAFIGASLAVFLPLLPGKTFNT